jgi:hypothetical protein
MNHDRRLVQPHKPLATRDFHSLNLPRICRADRPRTSTKAPRAGDPGAVQHETECGSMFTMVADSYSVDTAATGRPASLVGQAAGPTELPLREGFKSSRVSADPGWQPRAGLDVNLMPPAGRHENCKRARNRIAFSPPFFPYRLHRLRTPNSFYLRCQVLISSAEKHGNAFGVFRRHTSDREQDIETPCPTWLSDMWSKIVVQLVSVFRK